MYYIHTGLAYLIISVPRQCYMKGEGSFSAYDIDFDIPP